MRIKTQIIFWISVFVILLIGFGRLSGNLTHSFYFVSFFLPIIIATSVVFNEVLIEKYLLRKKYRSFVIYCIYLLIVSLNIEMILVFVSFTIMAYFNQDNMGIMIRDFRFMPLVMYLVVFIYAFIAMLARIISYQSMMQLQENKSADEYIILRSERKNRRVVCKSILYVESMSDYVRLFTIENETIITRETISRLNDRLPDGFLRIHRSYVINTNYLDSFNREEVIIRNKSLPISRTYKAEAIETLNNLL